MSSGGTAGWNSGILTGYSPTIQSTNGGTITITGITGQTGGTNSSYGIDMNNGSYPGDPSIGGTSQSGAITYIANSANWGSSTHYYTTQTTGKATFDVRSAGTTVDVGGTSNGTLGLTNTLLSSVTAGSIFIGDTTNAGNMRVETTNTFSVPLALLSSGNVTLSNQLNDSASGGSNPVVVISAGGNFINNTGNGTSTIHLTGGSSPVWHVYSTAPGSDTNGASAMGPTTTVYGTTYPTTTGASGNTWFYSSATNEGKVYITATSHSDPYGTSESTTGVFNTTYTCSGAGSSHISGAAALAFSGGPAPALPAITMSAWTITPSPGSITWNSGYTGRLAISPAR